MGEQQADTLVAEIGRGHGIGHARFSSSQCPYWRSTEQLAGHALQTALTVQLLAYCMSEKLTKYMLSEKQYN
jgi:hypothetical protein